jgi:hypothetical protein
MGNQNMNQEITCPKCSFQFALDQALNREIELQMRKKLREEFERKESDLRQQLAKEAAERTERNSAELQIRLEAQAKELKQARENERALLRTKAELQEQAEKAELEAQRKLSNERDKIRKAAQDQVLEEHRLKDADKNKQLEDMRRQIEDLKRKAEQGSQKLQGDVQEIELEKALRERFPRDQIESVKSGARGADVLQKVRSDSGQLCGTILWESKRVRNWSDKWIDKLIEDKQAAKADVAVIVTDALPEHVQHMGGVRGVLITTFPLAACLAETLRVNMALLAQTRLALGGQDDQKSRIFQYFMSPQFHERLATIADQFQQMQADLAREKAAMNRTWAKREKQMEMIVSSTGKFCEKFPTSAAILNFSRSSLRHLGASIFGQTTKSRRASRRARSSSQMRADSIVLPRPTSSAISKRSVGDSMNLSTGLNWYSMKSMPAASIE